jgi:protein TonB
MNPRISLLLLLAAWLLLGGCDYEHPNGRPTGQAMDTRLLGHWRKVDDKPAEKNTYLTVTRISADRFAVRLDDDTYEAYGIDFPVARPQIVELQVVDARGGKPKPGKNYLYTLINFERGQLIVMRLTPTEKLKLNSTAEQQAYLGRMIQTDQPYGQRLAFVPTDAEEVARAQTERAARNKAATGSGSARELADEIFPSRQGGEAGAAPRQPLFQLPASTDPVSRTVEPPTRPVPPPPAAAAASKDAPPVLRSGGPPRYPEALRRAGITGRVAVEYTVTPEGRVTGATVIESSHPEFDQSALEAVARWLYTPAMKAGRPIPARMQQEFRFDLGS